MATVNLRQGSASSYPGGNTGYGWNFKEFILNFAKTNRSAADVLQLMDMPKGATIQKTQIEVLTAEGGAATVDLGLQTAAAVEVDNDGFFNNLDINAAAGTITNQAAGGAAYAAAFPDVTADWILSLIVNNDVDAAKIAVRVWLIGAETGAAA